VSDVEAIVPLAHGFEEIEAVAIIDVLRRAGIAVAVAGVGGLEITGSHGISITCDRRIEACDPSGAAAVVLPGGMPGTRNLGESTQVVGLVGAVAAAGGLVAAVCAAPTILNALGLLEGRRATSHPAHADEMDRCRYVEEAVVTDGNVVTSRGAGTSIAFAATVVSRLRDPGVARDVLARMVAPID
jgi:4-methyl-5(b-hydroxyethyl)-thiazole monophosphate biosynthesis